MRTQRKLSSLAIGNKIRVGLPFVVGSEGERKEVLRAAKFAGAKIATRARDGKDGFDIYFLE